MPVFTDDLTAGLKAGMRRLAASVCVVSLNDNQSQPRAMTATAVTSLSDNPPALLVCINKQASAYQPLLDGQDFCINVLNEDQQDISILCASESDSGRFSLGDWQLHENNLKYLKDAEAVFFCANEKAIEYGSHIIVIGKLVEVRTGEAPVKPLLYADGSYRNLNSQVISK